MTNTEYLLFYPSVELGGAEMLFARLADELATLGHKVTVLDSEKQIIIKHIQNETVEFIVLTEGNPVLVKSKYILAFASHITTISRYIHKDSVGRLLFWNVHPLNSIYLPPVIGEKLFHIGIGWLKNANKFFFPEEDNVRKAALRYLIKNRAFVCMDGECSDTISKYYSNIKISDYIPIPVPKLSIDVVSDRSISINEDVTFLWYGRLCDFKFYGLIYLIQRIASLKNTNNVIKLIIVGDGPFRKMVQKALKKFDVRASLLGALPNKEALKLIATNADIVFAMGTAALETAALGIPTILAPASFGPIRNDYRFEWFYETTNYNLGSFAKSGIHDKGLTVEEILIELRTNFSKHANLSSSYVEKNHQIDHVVNLVRYFSANSTMDFSDFTNITQYKRPFLIRLLKYCNNKFNAFTKII